MWGRLDTGDTPVSEIVPSYSGVKTIFESILARGLKHTRSVTACPGSSVAPHTNFYNIKSVIFKRKL